MHSAAIHLLRRVREVDAKAMGISPARASALSVLVFGGARSLTELAAAERVTTATMSKLVTAMEGEGLVRRYPDVNDARVDPDRGDGEGAADPRAGTRAAARSARASCWRREPRGDRGRANGGRGCRSARSARLECAVPSGWVGILTCELHFPEAHSLKEKRHFLRSAKAQLAAPRRRVGR